jgi:hypothetical protein
MKRANMPRARGSRIESRTPPRRGRGAGALLLAWIPIATLIGGCLDKPTIDEQWTRLDILGSNLTPNQALPATPESISVKTAVTYRSVITGFAVAELRESGTLANNDVTLDPKAPRLTMATDIDRILASSVSVGRSVRAVTGWDHLIQPIDFHFVATASTAMDTSAAPGGSATGLFLLCYLGSGQRIERRGAPDSIAVTPFTSSAYEILPVGMKLAPPGTPVP